jgi:hypothetical protein
LQHVFPLVCFSELHLALRQASGPWWLLRRDGLVKCWSERASSPVLNSIRTTVAAVIIRDIYVNISTSHYAFHVFLFVALLVCQELFKNCLFLIMFPLQSSLFPVCLVLGSFCLLTLILRLPWRLQPLLAPSRPGLQGLRLGFVFSSWSHLLPWLLPLVSLE